MIRIRQRESTVGFQVGDCFSACIASILEVPLADVPVFTLPPYKGVRQYWQLAVNDWLRLRGYTLMGAIEEGVLSIGTECFHIMCGPTDESGDPNSFHAVVGYGDRPIWDPNSAKRPLLRIEQRWFIIPTDWRHVRTPLVGPWIWNHPMADALTMFLYGMLGTLAAWVSGALPGSGP